jgi:two-component system sensor histidine kinase UhpB
MSANASLRLHDETAQFLTALRLNLSTLDQLVPQKPELTRLIERLQGLNREMSRGIYRMVHDLRPAQLDDLGLEAALQHLVDEERRRSGLAVKLEVSGLRQRLDPLVETVLFRIAQEAISNVARHAGCKQALLLLCIELNQVSLKIVDEGAGFDMNQRQSPPRGWGLAGMRERAESAGGQLNLKSIPGQGTQVEVIIPLSLTEQPEFEEARDEYHPYPVS